VNKKLSREPDEKKIVYFHPTGTFYYERGLKAMEIGDLPTAKKLLTRAVELAPDHAMINCQLAIVLTECEEFERSNEILMRVLREINPDMHEVNYFIANNYAFLGMYHKAIKFAKRYLQESPYGEFAEAARQLLEVLALDYDDFDDLGRVEGTEWLDEDTLLHYQELANDLLEEGELERASEVLNDLLEKFPDYWPAYNNLAFAHYYSGKPEKAIAITRTVLEKNPGNLHALCNLTVFKYQAGNDIRKEIAMLKKIYPISADHRYKLGVTLTMVGEYHTGYKWLKTLRNLANFLDGNFYYWLSYAAYFSGKMSVAEKAWKQFITIHPEKAGEEPWKVDTVPDRP